MYSRKYKYLFLCTFLKSREELIDIRSDNLLEVEYNEKSISEFWIRRQQEYPSITKEALVDYQNPNSFCDYISM